MVLVKILKRKDASSIIVAVVVAMIVGQLLMMTMQQPASELVGLNNGPYGEGAFGGPDWKATYLTPVVSAALQLVALEVLAWVTIAVAALAIPKKRKK